LHDGIVVFSSFFWAAGKWYDKGRTITFFHRDKGLYMGYICFGRYIDNCFWHRPVGSPELAKSDMVENKNHNLSCFKHIRIDVYNSESASISGGVFALYPCTKRNFALETAMTRIVSQM